MVSIYRLVCHLYDDMYLGVDPWSVAMSLCTTICYVGRQIYWRRGLPPQVCEVIIDNEHKSWEKSSLTLCESQLHKDYAFKKKKKRVSTMCVQKKLKNIHLSRVGYTYIFKFIDVNPITGYWNPHKVL